MSDEPVVLLCLDRPPRRVDGRLLEGLAIGTAPRLVGHKTAHLMQTLVLLIPILVLFSDRIGVLGTEQAGCQFVLGFDRGVALKPPPRQTKQKKGCDESARGFVDVLWCALRLKNCLHTHVGALISEFFAVKGEVRVRANVNELLEGGRVQGVGAHGPSVAMVVNRMEGRRREIDPVPCPDRA